MDTKQPEALRLAHIFEHPLPPEWSDMVAATKELRRQHTENATLQSGYDAARLEIASLRERVQQLGQLARDVNSRRAVELEAQLAAVGAGGMEPLRKRCREPAKAGWCDGCSPDNCGGCVTPASPAQAGEPWYGHKFKESQSGIWRCECGKTVKETTADWLDMSADELRNLRTETAALCADYDADRAALEATQASECGNCFEGETDRGHACRKCGGTGAAQAAPVGMEPVARIEGIDEYGPRLEWTQHWVDVGVGAKLFTESQVQAMLAAEPIQTLEEAIAHAEDKAKGNSACAMEHAKLAAWLTELQLLRAARTAPVDADTGRLNWLERHSDGFYNLDRISAIVGKGFFTGPFTDKQKKHATLREAIDAARAAQEGKHD